MKYLLETYGCQMNKAESAALECQFRDRAWSITEDPLQADAVIINTCSVRITAETRAFGRIAHFAALKKKKKFVLIVTGCMAQRLKEDMKIKYPAVDYVLGTFQKSTFGVLIDAIEKGKHLDAIEETPKFVFAKNHAEPNSFLSFIPIMHGCNNFCTYCIVPYVRGREISRDPQEVCGEIESLSKAGIKEITLLGQNVNSYNWEGQNGTVNFAKLLKIVAEAAKKVGIGRISFVSSHPKDLSDETIEVMANDPIFARHIHLCVQHGSNAVLKAMNRKYTVEDYIALVKKIKNRIPEIGLSTDILIGFPGETEEDVEKTLELMRTVRFSYAYMYHYNVREGTPAASMPGRISEEVKIERLSRVIELQKEISRSVMKELVGTEANVLVESVSKKNENEVLARTDRDMMLVFEGSKDLIGKFVKVKLDSVRGNTFRATQI